MLIYLSRKYNENRFVSGNPSLYFKMLYLKSLKVHGCGNSNTREHWYKDISVLLFWPELMIILICKSNVIVNYFKSITYDKYFLS